MVVKVGLGARSRRSTENTRRVVGLHLGSGWQAPNLDESQFQHQLGSSVVEEFVIGHDPIDVLRELVQNEFDAGGNRMSVTFSDTAMTIGGTGKAIDAKGWKRLSVILGTGRVVGSSGGPEVSIAPKEHGIGSKNFGLRSLFLFGDRIYVRSNGTMAVLDLPTLGTNQLPDPSSVGTAGVSIHVPFRLKASGKLMAFEVERERHAIEAMAADLFNTLGKLSLTGARKGIGHLSISSVRTGLNLDWTQRATLSRCAVKGVTAIQRSGRLVQWDSINPEGRSSATFEEYEFSRSVPIPATQSVPSYPSYYKSRKGSVKVAISIPIRRKRIDLGQAGYFHYPLRAPSAATGMVLSANAPFELDADRSGLIGTEWNERLAREAGSLAVALLAKDWVDRFGPECFLAVRDTGNPNRPWMLDQVNAGLRDELCWPTEAKGTSVLASELVVAPNPELRGFLDDSRDLRAEAEKLPGVSEMAKIAGAKTFGVNSLVRLRCAGEDERGLQTKIGTGEANFYFRDYPKSISMVQRQVKFARALEKVARNFSANNRNDLKTSPSTLAADGSLKPAATLTVVPEEVWTVCPVPLSSRLHPSLRDFRVISSLGRPFNINAWVIDVAARARDDTASEEELEALYTYLLRNIEVINRAGINAVRRSPVIKDTEGSWSTPSGVAMLSADQARILKGIVKEPSGEAAHNAQLMARLSIRRKLSADDLIAMAEAVADDPLKASECEDFIAKNFNLLTPKVAANLQRIPFLRSKANSVAAPDTLHLDVPACALTLDDPGLIVGGRHIGLYKVLKVRSRPSFEVLADTLRRLRHSNKGPARPEAIYPALATAAASERKGLESVRNDAILWVDGKFHAPSNVLVGHSVPKCLDMALPVVRNRPILEKAYAELGAARQPVEPHWASFFRWVGTRASEGWRPSKPERAVLRQAYSRCFSTGLPKAVDNSVKCLLSLAGTLHTRQELADAKLLENDYPQLAEALIAAGSKVQFADLTEGGDQFRGGPRISDSCLRWIET